MRDYKPIEQRRPLRIALSLLLVCAIVVSAVAVGLFSTTAIAADTIIEIGPDSGRATAVQLNSGRIDGLYAIEDQYEVIWGTDTQVELFRVSYENDRQEVTVAGRNNEKVIAPGTENTYTFAVKNKSTGWLDYKLIVQAFFTGLDGTDKEIPIQARLQGRQWLVGGETEYRPVLELDGAEETTSVGARRHINYTLQWQWPFEQDLDGDGNIDDGDALDTWLASQGRDISLTIRITVLAGYHQPDEDPVLIPVPPSLDGTRHRAYLEGYPDGTVRPNAQITRAEVAAIFYRLLLDDVREQYKTDECSFPDVVQDAWYRTEVATLTRMGILTGYPDGLFRGDDTITRAEMAAILARLSEREISNEGKTDFPDIKGHWAEAEIMTIEDFNWIEGYPDGTFLPEAQITRAETVTMVNRMLHRLPTEISDLLHGHMVTWPDNQDPEAWYYLAIQEASNSHHYQRLLGTREKWTSMWPNDQIDEE